MGDIEETKVISQVSVSRTLAERYSRMFPIGAQSFINLVTEFNVFADKTLLIEKILNLDTIYNLITRPRRWGKSLNLNMIKTFLEARLDEAGNISDTKNKVFFEGGPYKDYNEDTTLLKPLKIAQFKNDKFYKSSLGKFPVISLNFNEEADQDLNSDLFRQSIQDSYANHDDIYRFMLINLIKYHNETLGTGKIKYENIDLDLLERAVFLQIPSPTAEIVKFKKYRDGDSEIKIQGSIKFLLKVLNKYFKKPVYVLIDEYDTVLNKYAGTLNYDAALSRLRSILLCLKDNALVKKVVFMGIAPICLGTLFSGLNSVCSDTVLTGSLSGNFAEYFGLTTEEVKDLVSQTVGGGEIEAKKLEEGVKSWYNGYRIGKTTIYNPWSIMHCLKHYFTDPTMNPYDNYWVHTGNFNLIDRMIEKVKFSTEIDSLLKIGELHHNIETDKSYGFLQIDSKEEIIVNDFCKLLLHSGYLTVKSENVYQIPNKEIVTCYHADLLPRWMISKYEHGSMMACLINNLTAYVEEKKKYFSCIQQIFLDNLTEKDKASKNENDFQEMMAAPARIFQIVSSNAKHILRSEVSTEEGMRTDHLFFPIKTRSETGIVHEYTQTDNSSRKNDLMIEALWQIFAKLYLEPLVTEINGNELTGQIRKIIARAIVFYLSGNGSGWAIDYIECNMDADSARQLIEIVSSSPYKNKLASQSIEIL